MSCLIRFFFSITISCLLFPHSVVSASESTLSQSDLSQELLSKNKTLQLNTWSFSPLSNSSQTGYLDQVLIEAFRRIDFQINIRNRPVERSIQEANKGDVDGEFIRVAGMEHIYSNLIRVPIELFEFEFVAFSNKKNLKVTSWNSLKSHYVGIVIGWKILEQNIPKTQYRFDLGNRHTLFKMLGSGRIDIAIYSKYVGKTILKELDYQHINLIEPPLARKKMYLYLHKKHRVVVPRIATALQNMYYDGTFKKIQKRTLFE